MGTGQDRTGEGGGEIQRRRRNWMVREEDWTSCDININNTERRKKCTPQSYRRHTIFVILSVPFAASFQADLRAASVMTSSASMFWTSSQATRDL
jgi:hypothetical protein